MNRNWLIALIALALIVICCLCLVGMAAFGGLAFFGIRTAGQTVEQPFPSFSTPEPTLQVLRPTRQNTPSPEDSPSGPDGPLVTRTVSPATGLTPQEMYDQLKAVTLPVADLVNLAERLEGKSNIPATLTPPEAFFEPGATSAFNLLDTDTNENFQVDAVLRYVTEHSYFWIEDGVDYDEDELRTLAETFESQIYPTNRQFFGSEWTPGIDGDPHLYILYARGLGSNVAGYYSSGDEFPPEASENSNGHEMFVFNADNVTLGEEYVYATLAHEFQHMIHFNVDRNEELWVNEGFAELAAFINGYGIGGHDWVFAMNPDLQLTSWAGENEDASPYYGAAFLFINYFFDRFGEEVTKNVVADPNNGMGSMDQVLSERGITDPLTGETANADDVFADWTVTNFLLNSEVGDGRYTYRNYDAAPQISETETISSCPSGVQTRDVSQYGSDYIRIDCSGDYTLHFEGSLEVPVVPTQPQSGQWAFWSNRGDESNPNLTRSFDLSGVSGPVTLSYWTWYDLEKDFDFVYVEASLDGENWTILDTPSGSGDDPTGNSYGWGYTGASGAGPQWIEETVDLSAYAGQQVQIRFDYVSDAAINYSGFLVDDISVPEINYFTDFEADDGGWQANGFVRLFNVLPQTYELSIIRKGSTTTVERIQLTSDNLADIPLQIGGDVDEVILVVSGSTRITREKTVYSIEIRE